MIALFRYLILRNGREGWLAALLVGPALLLLSPFIVLTLFEVLRGHAAWPMPLGRNEIATLRTIPILLVIVCGVAASVASFFAFARESGNKALGSIVLATRPRVVVLVAALFGTVGALVSFGVAQLVVQMIRISFTGGAAVAAPEGGAMLVAEAVLASACGASIGVAMVSMSPGPTMLLPTYVAATVTGAWLSTHLNAFNATAALLGVAVALTVATWFMRRRCAA